MKLSMRLSATLAASTLAGLAISSSVSAAPAAARDYIERSVPDSPNGKDVFRHTVKVPRAGTLAAAKGECQCPMMAKAAPAPDAARPQQPDQ